MLLHFPVQTLLDGFSQRLLFNRVVIVKECKIKICEQRPRPTFHASESVLCLAQLRILQKCRRGLQICGGLGLPNFQQVLFNGGFFPRCEVLANTNAV